MIEIVEIAWRLSPAKSRVAFLNSWGRREQDRYMDQAKSAITAIRSMGYDIVKRHHIDTYESTIDEVDF